MKKLITYVIFFVLGTSFVQAQEDENETQAKNEIKLNASNLIAFTFIDVSYESLLNE